MNDDTTEARLLRPGDEVYDGRGHWRTVLSVSAPVTRYGRWKVRLTLQLRDGDRVEVDSYWTESVRAVVFRRGGCPA